MDKKLEDKQKLGMTRQQCMELIENLALKHEFYSMLYAHLKEMECNDPDAFENAMQALEAENFQEPVHLVLCDLVTCLNLGEE